MSEKSCYTHELSWQATKVPSLEFHIFQSSKIHQPQTYCFWWYERNVRQLWQPRKKSFEKYNCLSLHSFASHASKAKKLNLGILMYLHSLNSIVLEFKESSIILRVILGTWSLIRCNSRVFFLINLLYYCCGGHFLKRGGEGKSLQGKNQ